MPLITQKIRQYLCCLALCFTTQVTLAGNLEIVDGNLVDNRTGMVWMPLLTDQKTEPPSGFRGAFFSELDSILPMAAVQTVTADSDIYKAFTFFSTSLSAPQSGCGSTLSSFSSCLRGWFFDEFTPNDPVYGQPQNLAFFTIEPKINAINGSVSSTEFTFSSISTLGPYYYSPSYTPDGNNYVGFGRAIPLTRPLFVVSGVPEPSSVALLPLGLAVLLIRKKLKIK